MALKVITDSASDLPGWFIEKHKLHVIPTPVVINEVDYFDGQTIFPEDFYQILKSGTSIRTYHINSFMFKQNFEPYARNGDEVIYVCFSTGIAGTFNAANLARTELLETYPDFDLTIIDSRCASLGFGLAVEKAVRMLEEGEPKQKIIDAVHFYCEHMEQIFTVETLEYLYKGGRLSRTSAIAGGILDIKPVIEVNEAGALVPIEKIRGRQRSLRRLVEITGDRGADLKNQTIGIVHGDDLQTLKTVKDMLIEKYGCKDFMESYVGCAIGAHTGPGVIGIIFLNEKSPYGC